MPTESFQCKEMLISIKLATFFLTKVFLPIDGFLFGSNVIYNDVCNKKKKKKEAQSQGTVTWWQRNAKFFGKKK